MGTIAELLVNNSPKLLTKGRNKLSGLFVEKPITGLQIKVFFKNETII
jgi:hypothetical protein